MAGSPALQSPPAKVNALEARLDTLQHIDCRYEGTSLASQQQRPDPAQRLFGDPFSKTTGTAPYAIGDDRRVLDLARTIAPDRSQPLLLRKAPLNLIGRHGEAADLTVLRVCGDDPFTESRTYTPGRPLEDQTYPEFIYSEW